MRFELLWLGVRKFQSRLHCGRVPWSFWASACLELTRCRVSAVSIGPSFCRPQRLRPTNVGGWPFCITVCSVAEALRRRPWDMQPPWEQGSFGGVLGSGSLFKPLVVPLDYASSVQSDQEDQPKRPPVKIAREPWKAAVVHSKAWADLEDDKRTSILEVWKLLILTSANGTKVGENLASMQSSGATDLEIAQCLRDTFASKSTATLRARSSSLAHFARWKASAAVFPLLEPDAYRYACFLRSEGAPASRGPRFKEAMNFAGALLGVDVREVTSSSRIQGAVNPGSSASAVRKKAPLTVAQVRALEEFVCGADSDLSRVIGGFLLYLIHGRLRWSDAQHTEAEPQLDLVQGKGFLCALLYHHKTANRGSLAWHRLLPVACLTPGVGELNWGQAWLEARRRMQLRASRGLPLMPRPLIAGGFDTVPLDPLCGCGKSLRRVVLWTLTGTALPPTAARLRCCRGWLNQLRLRTCSPLQATTCEALTSRLWSTLGIRWRRCCITLRGCF